MARMTHDQLQSAMISKLSAEPDPSGRADLICPKGSLGIAADNKQIKKTVKRLRPLEGYRYLVINRADLFAASPATIGTKIGILDANGSLLKAADLPRTR
ncbi:MAG: hypothetical protein OXF41_05365 [bacterium]|nr:hypothetical protein [bacterium]